MGVRPGLALSLNSLLKTLLPTPHIQMVTKGVGTATFLDHREQAESRSNDRALGSQLP